MLLQAGESVRRWIRDWVKRFVVKMVGFGAIAPEDRHHRLHAGGHSASTYGVPTWLRRSAKPREEIKYARVAKN